jgi:hypothetical protein
MHAWIPPTFVILMAAAAIEAAVHHDWMKATYWILDAALTGVAAFGLK